MSIQVRKKSDKEMVISLDKNFDFSCVEDFRRAYEQNVVGANATYIVDFKSTHYIDSSALGMLINLQKHVSGQGSKVLLTNPSQEVRKIFSISRFDKKFTIQ